MKLYITLIFGILFLFTGIVICPLLGFHDERPEFLIILCVYIIVYNNNKQSILLQTWLVGLLKDCMTLDLFGLHSLLFIFLSYTLLKLKQTMHLTNTLVLLVLVFFYTFQYHLLHSMIIYVTCYVDLADTAFTGAIYTTIVAPIVIIILKIFTHEPPEGYLYEA
ncbi:rod shape-determining protein MreD [Candidatus Uabimicrobium sp. HlEnr_7]|uniref:rod shape-determining protein MreD n=1 Tax=Candidatus Uabimicrobium helgolandensis TaxID=3095367 RepID=UPI003556BD5B